MNGQLLTLVMATGLFMAAWTSQDRTKPTIRGVHGARTNATVTPPCRMREPSPRLNVAATSTIACKPAIENRVWTAVECPAPLPEDIRPGVYCVVNNVGTVGMVQLTAEDVGCRTDADATADGLYVVTVGTCRWYFIERTAQCAPCKARSAAAATAGVGLRDRSANESVARWFEVTAAGAMRWFGRRMETFAAQGIRVPRRLEMDDDDFDELDETDDAEESDLDLPPLPPEVAG